MGPLSSLEQRRYCGREGNVSQCLFELMAFGDFLGIRGVSELPAIATTLANMVQVNLLGGSSL